MAEHVVHQHQRQHSFHHRCCANTYTGIMPTLGHYFDFITINIQTPAWQPQTRGGFERGTDENILPGGYATKDTACMVT